MKRWTTNITALIVGFALGFIFSEGLITIIDKCFH